MLSHVALISLDPWDGVWRRNQHLASRLVSSGRVRRLTYVDPPARTPHADHEPLPGVKVRQPRKLAPERVSRTYDAAAQVRPWVGDADVVWINDPVLGASLDRLGALTPPLPRRPDRRQAGRPPLSPREPGRRRPTFVYDVTDDWRGASQAADRLTRLVAAEDRLGRRALTVVCSPVLRDRWWQRYGVKPLLVRNGFDPAPPGPPAELPGPGPHVGYVGSLHTDRLDVDLVCAIAAAAGTVHLVGPDYLDDVSRAKLEQAGVRRPGPVSHDQVAALTAALDVVVCPHRVTPFTLSLDAIKSYEALASGRPVVATPTSGFQELAEHGVHLPDPETFVACLREVLASLPRPSRPIHVGTWDERAEHFADVLDRACR